MDLESAAIVLEDLIDDSVMELPEQPIKPVVRHRKAAAPPRDGFQPLFLAPTSDDAAYTTSR